MSYIDPGSGSMAVQVLVATGLGIIIAFWQRIRGLFQRLFGKKA